MKKLILLSSLLILLLNAHSQKRAMIPKSIGDVSVRVEHKSDIMDISNMNQRVADFPQKDKEYIKSTLTSETQIGVTWYDLQSNGAMSNRIHYFPDGTISAVWTMGFQSPAFPDRGTGYNYFDGSYWDSSPLEGIESDRCGWPSIAAWGNNGEIVVSHISVGSNDGLLFNKRVNKGQGTWEEFLWQGPTPANESVLWPRLTTSGDNNEYIHLLCVTTPTTNGGTPYMGQDAALLYSRSTNGGISWDIQWEILEGTGIDYYYGFSSDEYIWAEPQDSVIAFACISAWYDMFIMKSTDHGLNWEKIMVWEHPYPFFDWDFTITTDTLWAPDYSADIAIDSDGKVHLVCGLTRVAHTEPGTSYDFWPATDGIAYWNEDMPPFEAPNQHDALDAEDVLIEGYNLVGWTQDIDGNGTVNLLDEIMSYRSIGLSTMPDLSIDENDNIFLVYASTTETYDNGTYNYKHIWARASNAGGGFWCDFVDLDEGLIHIFDECIYPVIAGDSDDQIHLIYNIDPIPGLAVLDDHVYLENNITYAAVDKDILITDVPNINIDPQNITVISPDLVDDFSIQNSGSQDLTIYSIEDDQDWLSTSAYPTTPFVITPGNSQNVIAEIDWALVGTSITNGLISIQSNDPGQSLEYVEVTVIPDYPELCVDPLEFDLGLHPGLYNFSHVFNVENCSGGILTGDITESAEWIDYLSLSSFILNSLENEIVVFSGAFPETPGDFETNISITSNGGNVDVHVFGTVEQLPSLYVDQLTFDLGTHSAGFAINENFIVKNDGGGHLAGNINESLSWITDVNPSSFNIAAGVQYYVNFIGVFPNDAGPFSGILYIITNGGDEQITVNGTVEANPILLVTPTYIDLGTDTIGHMFSESFIITNTGNSTLNGSISETADWISDLDPLTFDVGSGENLSVEFAGTFPEGDVSFSTSISVASDGGSETVFISGINDLTSVDDNQMLIDRFKIYPNPTQGSLFIETSLIDQSNIELVVYNSFGKIIEMIDFGRIQSCTISIDLTKYGNGIYYLKLESDISTFIEKVCVAN